MAYVDLKIVDLDGYDDLQQFIENETLKDDWNGDYWTSFKDFDEEILYKFDIRIPHEYVRDWMANHEHYFVNDHKEHGTNHKVYHF